MCSSLRWIRILLLATSTAFAASLHSAPAFEVEPGRLDLAGATGFPFADVLVPITRDPSIASLDAVAVTSDAAWQTGHIGADSSNLVVRAATGALPASTYQAKITINGLGASDSLLVEVTLAPLHPVALRDDPGRGRMYALHQNGPQLGALVTFDPSSLAPLAQVTVGRGPTDFAVSPDGGEVLVMCAGAPGISAIAADSLTLTEQIELNVFGTTAGGSAATPRVDYGATDILYYTDAGLPNTLWVMERSTRRVLQGSQSDPVFRDPLFRLMGWNDFVVSPDRTTIFGCARNFGATARFYVRHAIAPDGRLSFVESSRPGFDTVPNALPRESVPALTTADGAVASAGTVALDARSVRTMRAVGPGDIFALSAEGTLFTTDNSIHEFATGRLLASLPNFSEVQAFTADRSALIAYDHATSTLDRIDLRAALGAAYPEALASPADLSTVCRPERLAWPTIPGAQLYRVFLGTSETAVAQATLQSSEYLGETAEPWMGVADALEEGATYHWRVDSIGPQISSSTLQRSFRVSAVTSSSHALHVSTVEGNSGATISLQLESASAGVAWSLAGSLPWITPSATSGVTPAQVDLRIDASALTEGFHLAEVRLTTATGTAVIPLRLELTRLALVDLRSEPTTDRVFGLSEDTESPVWRAHLLEIDAASGAILRAAPAGGSATSLAIHPGDDRIYVANWLVGSLLAFDRQTLQPTRQYPFQPFLGKALNRYDVYQVSAGGPGRLMIEDADQQIDVRLFDTQTGTVLSSVVGFEGVGAFAPDRRFFFHGEYGTTGNRLVRLDTAGDVIQLSTSGTYVPTRFLENRGLVVSEGGQRVFWHGAVFDPDLNLLWAHDEVIGAASATGALAFGSTRIFDTVEQRAALGMPVNSIISAFNTTAQRLIMQQGSHVGSWEIDPAAAPRTPFLAVSRIESDRALLRWSDESLETHFELQWRIVGAADWINASAPVPANTTEFTAFPLTPNRNYEFRIRAVTGVSTSAWSTPAAARTPASTQTPALTLRVLDTESIALTWAVFEAHDTVTVERKLFGGFAWTPIANLPATITTFTDTGLRTDTSYVYRVTPKTGAVILPGTPEIWTSIPRPPAAPVFTEHPANVVAMAGSVVTLPCMLSGTAPITVRWYRNGELLPATPGYALTLTAHPSIEGHYTAEATNAMGTTRSLSATLTVVPSVYAGIHFGGFYNGAGEWAILVRPDGTATALFALRSPACVGVAHTTINAQGRIEDHVRLIRPDGTVIDRVLFGVSISDGSGPVPRTTVSGNLGVVASLLSGIGEPTDGPFSAMAGLHLTPQVGGGTATLWTMLGATGRSLSVALGGTLADGSIAILPASGEFAFTGVGGASFTLAPTPTQHALAGTVTLAGRAPAHFATILAPGLRTDRLVNISSRGATEAGNNVMIAGFYVTGTSTRRVLVRCAGPALARWNIDGRLEDPSLTLHDHTEARIAANDDWGLDQDSALVRDAAAHVSAFAFAEGSKDAALLVDLSPGSYTAIARGADTGVVLTEIYDVTGIDATSQAINNLSIRARVGSDEAIVVGGFVIRGNSPKRVLIRGVGPTLDRFGLPSDAILSDPQLTLFSGPTPIAANDDWGADDDPAGIAAATSVAGAFSLPIGSKDAATVVVLQPGSYTAQVRGTVGTTGICLLEIYQLP